MDFVGAKAALFSNSSVLTYLRDDRPGLRWAGHWDLPGGGREGDELPETCLLRELGEEFGLTLPPERLVWQRVFPATTDATRPAHFFAGWLTRDEIAAIRFGDEGQGWEMMPVNRYLSHLRAIPELQRRTALAWADLSAIGGAG